jgi:DNA-binding PadR family transcriptional regulator
MTRGPYWGHGGHWMWRGGPGGPRARRGDTRAAALLLLAEEPRNGYQLMQEIEERSDGVWRPSPGSVYPALQQLADEGLIDAKGKLYELTDTGRAHVEAHLEEMGKPWDAVKDKDTAGDGRTDAREQIGQTAMAFVQVMRVGNDEQRAQARKILVETRKKLYQLLSEDAE